MVNVIAFIITALVTGGAGIYIYKEKKKGVRCIGCPNGGQCPGKCGNCR